MDGLIQRLDEIAAPIGGAATIMLIAIGGGLFLLLVLTFLQWRSVRWAKRSHIQIAAQTEYLRRLQARTEKPEDAVARQLRDRLKDVDIVTKKVEPTKRSVNQGLGTPVAPTAHDDDDQPLQVDNLAMPEWRVWGVDKKTQVRGSAVIKATSVSHARRVAQQRGFDVETIERLEADRTGR